MRQILRTLPYSLLILWPFLRSFPQDYLDAAALDGAGPWAQIRRVVLPLTSRTLVAAWAISFAIGLGELPATNIVTPPGTQPMSVLVWGLLHTGVESHLSGVALIMLATIAVAGVFAAVAVYSLRRDASQRNGLNELALARVSRVHTVTLPVSPGRQPDCRRAPP